MPIEINQTRPYAEVRNDRRPGVEVYPEAEVVNYNVTTPLQHWAQDRDVTWPPAGTAGRVNQLREFRRLYDGDLSVIMRGLYGVRVNYFRRLSNNLSDLLLSYPPEVTSSPGGVDADLLQEEIFEALEGATVDLSRFGTALFRAWKDEDGPHVEDVQVERWFPAGRDGDAVIAEQTTQRMSTTTEVLTLPADGGEQRQRFLMAGAADYVAQQEPDGVTPGLSLGQRIASTSIESQYAIEGRSLFPVALRPATGPWGQSLYPPMYPLVTELCRRLSKSSHILNRHADPMLVFRRDRQYSPLQGNGPGAKTEVSTFAQRVFLDEWKEHWVQVVPPEFDDVSYLSWDAQMQANFEHYDRVRDELFATSPVTPALFAALAASQSGLGNVSLRKAFVGTYAFLLRVQHRLQRAVEQCASAAAGGEVTLEWPNALEEFDKQTITNVGLTGEDAREEVGEGSDDDGPVEVDQPSPMMNGAANGRA